MKKLIALIVAVMVMMGMCATTFAATNPKVAENGAISINGEGAFVLDATKVKLADDEDIANNSQTTVVVVAGQDAAITTTSIQYINQDSATSFTFIPKDDAEYKAGAEAVKLTAYIGGDEITKATAGYIDYELVAPTMYTVTFKNGDETLATAQYEAGTVGVTYSGDAPTKAEDENNTYAFSHWYYVEDSAEVRVDDLAALTVNSDITLFAAFTATAKATVTFNDGTNTTTVKYAIGTNIVTPAAPTKEGFTFVGWKLADDADATPTKDLSSVLVDGDKNFVAVFEEITVTPPTPDQPTEFTVTYMANGSVYATQATANGIPVLPEEPTKPNSGKKTYAFIGWYTDEALTAKLDKTAALTANVTLYAKFSQVGIYGDITLDGNVNNFDIIQIKSLMKQGAANYTGKAGTTIPDCQTYNGKVGKYGDVTCDGNVNNFDIIQIKSLMKQGAATYTGRAGTEMVMIKD